jgi:signal transduction histidine kinase
MIPGRAGETRSRYSRSPNGARELVRQILAFSRNARTEKKPINLGLLLEETHGLLCFSIPATIKVRLDIEAEMDTIRADPSGQVQQVVMNLATNAVQAMPEGEGILTLGLSNAVFRPYDHMPDEEMEPGNYVKLTVTDTGTGMTEEVKKRVFEPFFTTKAPGKGTGVGLAVIYGIVKDHGGSIMVESAPGKGSRFTVFFPLLKTRAKEKHEERTTPALLGAESGSWWSMTRRVSLRCSRESSHALAIR